MKNEFINFDSLHKSVKAILTDSLNEDDACKYEDLIDEQSFIIAQDTVESMRKCVHQRDPRIVGNFNNIRSDWDCHKDSYWVAKSENDEAIEVKPFGRFDDMVKGMAEGTLSEEQVQIVQTWCEEWFFDTFGTWGMRYNFQTLIGELEYEDEELGIVV